MAIGRQCLKGRVVERAIETGFDRVGVHDEDTHQAAPFFARLDRPSG
jgi:hypothetical protein